MAVGTWSQPYKDATSGSGMETLVSLAVNPTVLIQQVHKTQYPKIKEKALR